MEKCVYIEDEKTLYTFGPPGFQMENRFSKDLFPEFFGFKKIFLTKTLFPIRETKHLVAWITIKRIAALIHSFKLRQSENTRRIVNSPNFLFLILKPKNYVRINNPYRFHTGHRPLSPLAFRLSFCKLLFRWWYNQNQRQSLFATSSFSHADWRGR